MDQRAAHYQDQADRLRKMAVLEPEMLSGRHVIANEESPAVASGLEVISFELPGQTPPAQQPERKEDCAQQG
jgi:hypothetical protein